MNLAPYAGFIHPVNMPVTNANGTIIDVKISLPEDYIAQRMEYGKKYGFL